MSKYGNPEIYSRFLRADWLKESNSRVHSNAFNCSKNKNTERLEVSCFETQGLNTLQIQEIASTNNITLNMKPPVGCCSIQQTDFPFDKLEIDANYIPDRHIDLIKWENYPSKEDYKEITSLLAEIASNDIQIF